MGAVRELAGYAAPVVLNGRVYMIDYDRDRQEHALRSVEHLDPHLPGAAESHATANLRTSA